MALSNKRDKAVCSCYNDMVRIIDITDKKKPTVLNEFESDLEFINNFDWHISDQVIAMVGESPNVMLYKLENGEQVIQDHKNGHKCQTIPQVSWMENGNKLLTCGTMENGSSETILWDTDGEKYLDS